MSVSQNRDRAEVLWEIQSYFGCGTIRPDRSDLTVKWEVRSNPLLHSRVLPHFRQFPLRSGKQRDVELLIQISERIARGEHLVASSLIGIVELVGTMNPSGLRRYQIAGITNELFDQMKA